MKYYIETLKIWRKREIKQEGRRRAKGEIGDVKNVDSVSSTDSLPSLALIRLFKIIIR